MKKILMLLNLVFFTFSSCIADSDKVIKKESFFSKEINDINTKNISINHENSIFLEGKFKIIKPSKNQLAIYTETKKTRHIFLFNEVDELFDIEKNISKLSYLKDGILLNDALFLGIEGNVNKTMHQNIMKLSKNNTLEKIENFKMLSHYSFHKDNMKFKDLSIENLVFEISASIELSHEGDCKAGGEGATSCSLGSGATGCSVSCVSGFYACCVYTPMGPNDCHCDKKS